jgi:hypothetical protein
MQRAAATTAESLPSFFVLPFIVKHAVPFFSFLFSFYTFCTLSTSFFRWFMFLLCDLWILHTVSHRSLPCNTIRKTLKNLIYVQIHRDFILFYSTLSFVLHSKVIEFYNKKKDWQRLLVRPQNDNKTLLSSHFYSFFPFFLNLTSVRCI